MSGVPSRVTMRRASCASWPNSFSDGSVTNFAHVVVKEWLPLSVGRLGGQGVEQFGRSEPLVPSLEYHLFFLDHMHEFDSNQSVLNCLKRFEPQHGPCHPLDTSMLLLHD